MTESELKAWAFANSGIRCIGFGETITEARGRCALTAHPHYDGDEDSLINRVAAALNRTHPPEYARLIEAARKVEPFLDAIICYASTMDEHAPNKIVHEFRAALAAIKGNPNAQG